MSNDSYFETAEEMLVAWDAGEPVWSIEMGGLGPGYEQAIQVLAMELVRDFQLIDDWEAITSEMLEERRGRIYDLHFRGQGYSGAQVGAATGLAVQFCRWGPRKAVDNLGDDARHTMISRDWVQAPEPPGA